MTHVVARELKQWRDCVAGAAAHWQARVVGRHRLLHRRIACNGCHVDYVPAFTRGVCPVCQERHRLMPVVDQQPKLHAFGLRAVWLFAVIAFALLVHGLFS